MGYPGAASSTLVVRHTGQRFALAQAPVTVGRQADNTIVLTDPQASRHHATISFQAGTYVVQDMGSANGTYVNESRISGMHGLRNRDVLRVGNTLFDVQLGPDSAAMGKAPRVRPSASAPAYPPPAALPRSSRIPLIAGLLLAGFIVVAISSAIVFLVLGGRGGKPIVTVQSSAIGNQAVVGQEILLEASASGARDITRLEFRVDNVLVGTATSPDSAGGPSLSISQPWTFGQSGSHTVSATAYTAQGGSSEPALVSLAVTDRVGQVTPSAPVPSEPVPTAESPTPPPPTAEAPTSEPPTAPPTVPQPTAPSFTSTPTNSATPTPTGTATRTPTATRRPLPVIEFFRANPATITAGQCTTLEWGRVSNATTATIDHGIGGVGTPGNRQVCPAGTTTYIMTATGLGGVVTAKATVTVGTAQYDLYVRRMDFSPANPMVGQEISLSVMIATDIYPQQGPFFPASHFRWQQGQGYGWVEETCPQNTNYASCAVTVKFSYSQPGQFEVRVEADNRNEVGETDEANNARSWTIAIAASLPYPYQDIWQGLGGAGGPLGAPAGDAVDRVYAGQEFDHAFMFWQDNAGSGSNLIYVIQWGPGDDQTSGDLWGRFDDTWQAGDPDYSCAEAVPPNGPVRGFGKLWCTRSDIRGSVGVAFQPEAGDNGGWLPFVNGIMLWDGHNNRVFVVYNPGNWQAYTP